MNTAQSHASRQGHTESEASPHAAGPGRLREEEEEEEEDWEEEEEEEGEEEEEEEGHEEGSARPKHAGYAGGCLPCLSPCPRRPSWALSLIHI